jgi:nucleotide-binding universal stress UspA family protein
MTAHRVLHTVHVVVGLDRAGAHDHTVLTAALEHARRGHADVCIVHAIAIAAQLPTAPLDAAARHRQLATRRDHVQAATTDLRRQVAHLGAHDTVHYDVRYGDPATVILDAARHADLIVVGTRSNNHGSPLLLGTVSQDIAVHATCPVLLIPAAPTSSTPTHSS